MSMDDYNVLVRGPLAEVIQALTEALGPPVRHSGQIIFAVGGHEAGLVAGADYEDDLVGPLSTYPISVAILTGTNSEMESVALRVQQILHRFDTLALRNLSSQLPTSGSAAA